jgi:hypothetical protein
MNTTFKVGQTVKATVTAQGMIANTAYLVTAKHEEQYPWGNFVTYTLDGPAVSGDSLQIGNGHLVLQPV